MRSSLRVTNKLFRNLTLLILSAVVSATVLFLVWRTHPEISYWQNLAKSAQDILVAKPWILVLALATIPGLGFPISPLLVLVGIVLAPAYGMFATCVIAIIAQSTCSSWTYFASKHLLRKFLLKTVLKNRKIPKLENKNAMRLGLIIRITPGIPYAIQNVFLGISGMPFKTYMLASIPVQSLYTIAFILTGGALFQGKIGLALTGILLLIVIILTTRFLRNRNKHYAG